MWISKLWPRRPKVSPVPTLSVSPTILHFTSLRLIMFLIDLCVSAALDAVKENVLLPWSTTVLQNAPSPTLTPTDVLPQSVISGPHVSIGASSPSPSESCPSISLSDDPPRARILSLQNFTKALKEITPSSSEALGSLAELRKWNDEFGEGRKERRRKQAWGTDRFGFTDNGHRRGGDDSILHSTSKAAGV